MSSSNKSAQRTVVEQTHTTSVTRSFAKESKVLPSSYQLRFGERRSPKYSVFAGSRHASVDFNKTRATSIGGAGSTPHLVTTRVEEKAALGSLNNRFVTYIDKVRGLVTRNKLLELKVKQLESSQVIPCRAGNKYDARLHEIQKELEEAVIEKTQAELELENCYRDIRDIIKQIKREEEDRQDAENEVKLLCKDVDQATLEKVELEGKVESLKEELDLVRRVNDEDVRILTDQLIALRSSEVVIDGHQQTDLSESLRDIRAAYDGLTQDNKFKIEDYYKAKISDLTKQYHEEANSKKSNKTELTEARRQIHSLTVEIEGLRSASIGLSDQLEDVETRFQTESLSYQSTISEIEKELNAAKDKVQRQLLDYNELLNVKLSLDLEIETYQQLLEIEETRISIHSEDTSSGSLQVHAKDEDTTDEERKSRNYNMKKHYYTFCPTEVSSSTDTTSQGGQFPNSGRLLSDYDTDSSNSSSDQLDDEVVYMVNDVVQDMQISKVPQLSESWSLDEDELNPPDDARGLSSTNGCFDQQDYN